MVQSSGSALTTGWGPVAAQRASRTGWLRRCVDAVRRAAAGFARERARLDLMALDAHLRRDVGLEPLGPVWREVGPSSALDRWS